MTTLAYAGSCLLGLGLSAALVLALRVLLDALAHFHAAGLDRIHHHPRETNR